MVTRLTEKPLRLGFTIDESAANTFTTAPLNVPTTPSIAVSRGNTKAIGIEVMKVKRRLEQPDLEAGQSNASRAEIVKGPAPTALLGPSDQRVIMQVELLNQVTEVTAVGEPTTFIDAGKIEDLTDGDGNGEIVADNEIHIVVQGAGNAQVKTFDGYILYHLVELETTEALFELIETAQ